MMQRILRAGRGSATIARTNSHASQRCAGQSYGGFKSGHQKAEDAPNPGPHVKHPGPRSPAEKGSSLSAQAQLSSSKPTSKPGQSAEPMIHSPPAPDEKRTPDVEQHNKEMENKFDKTHNQLSEADNKVDKRFWQGICPSAPRQSFAQVRIPGTNVT